MDSKEGDLQTGKARESFLLSLSFSSSSCKLKLLGCTCILVVVPADRWLGPPAWRCLRVNSLPPSWAAAWLGFCPEPRGWSPRGEMGWAAWSHEEGVQLLNPTPLRRWGGRGRHQWQARCRGTRWGHASYGTWAAGKDCWETVLFDYLILFAVWQRAVTFGLLALLVTVAQNKPSNLVRSWIIWK